MKLQGNEKCWGFEFKIETNSIKFSKDLSKEDCKQLYDSFLEISRQMFTYGYDTDDLEFCKSVVGNVNIGYTDKCELSEYIIEH